MSNTTTALAKLVRHQQDLDNEIQLYKESATNKTKRQTEASPITPKSASSCLQELNNKLCSIKSLLVETEYRSQIIKDYMKRYENSRIAQNKIKIELAEMKLNKQIESLINERDNEEKSHNIIIKYLNESIKMLGEKLAFWKNALKEDMALQNIEIRRLESEKETQTQTIQDLIIDYARREREIENYLLEREEREKQEKIQEHITKSAIKIQAWWRGCMVRWNLGPYCPDSLAKKKKKKPKKK